MTNLTTADYMAMIENATYRDCQRLAAESCDVSMGTTISQLAVELYDFVLGDNESERAFAIFKEAIDESAINSALSTYDERKAMQESKL